MKIILFIFLFSLSLFSTGCFTYYPTRESPDSLKAENDRYSKILKFHLFDGKTIDVSEYEIKYYEKYKANEKVFVYYQPDTVVKNQNPDSLKIKLTEKIIPSDKIKLVTVERKKTDAKSTAFTALIILGSLALVFYIAVTISFHSNPPHL
ncbi:MAG: hypothetical protein WC358_11790 [Ignavibacteria bacterium]|jgi:hypothetical protein